MSICNCNTQVKNFGQPNCVGIPARPTKLVFVYTKTNDGARNAILSTDVIDDTFISGKLNEADHSKRWFLTGELNKINDARAEDNKFEVDGFQLVSSKGVRTVAFSVVDGASPQLAEAYESIVCRAMSFFHLSIASQIVGNKRIAGEMNPFRIKKKTVSAVYHPENKENETPAMIMVQFDLNENEKDTDITYIDEGPGAGSIAPGVDLLGYEGLVDVVMEDATAITTTTFTVDMNLIYGAVFVSGKDEAVGLLVGDFTLEEISPTPGAIVITSVDETDPGVSGIYDFVTPINVSGDILRLKLAKVGFEGMDDAGNIWLDITIP